MDEQKITPKKSEAGIEYIREMRLAGLIKRDIIPADTASQGERPPHYKELDIILWRDGRHRTLPRRDFSVRALIKPYFSM